MITGPWQWNVSHIALQRFAATRPLLCQNASRQATSLLLHVSHLPCTEEVTVATVSWCKLRKQATFSSTLCALLFLQRRRRRRSRFTPLFGWRCNKLRGERKLDHLGGSFFLAVAIFRLPLGQRWTGIWKSVCTLLASTLAWVFQIRDANSVDTIPSLVVQFNLGVTAGFYRLSHSASSSHTTGILRQTTFNPLLDSHSATELCLQQYYCVHTDGECQIPSQAKSSPRYLPDKAGDKKTCREKKVTLPGWDHQLHKQEGATATTIGTLYTRSSVGVELLARAGDTDHVRLHLLARYICLRGRESETSRYKDRLLCCLTTDTV